jgi:hypothetical protein
MFYAKILAKNEKIRNDSVMIIYGAQNVFDINPL